MIFSLLLKHLAVSWGAWVNFIYQRFYWCRTCCLDFSLTLQFTVCFSECGFIDLWVIFWVTGLAHPIQRRLMDGFFSFFFPVLFIKFNPFSLQVLWVGIWAWCADRPVWPSKLRQSFFRVKYIRKWNFIYFYYLL